jgi:hypothetical protein
MRPHGVTSPSPSGLSPPAPDARGAVPIDASRAEILRAAFVEHRQLNTERRVHFTLLSGGGIPGTADGGRPTRPGRARADNRSTNTSCSRNTLCRASSTSTPRLPTCTNGRPTASHSPRRSLSRSNPNSRRASGSSLTKVAIVGAKNARGQDATVSFLERGVPPTPIAPCMDDAVAACCVDRQDQQHGVVEVEGLACQHRLTAERTRRTDEQLRRRHGPPRGGVGRVQITSGEVLD